MLTIKKYIAMLLCLSLICSGAPIAFAVEDSSDIQQAIPYTLDEPYTFPYQPKTQEWIDLDSYSNRLDACQIPSDILTQLSTPALLRTILDYPFLQDISVFDNMKSKFNGIDELLSRVDIFEAAYEAYKNFDVDLSDNFGSTSALAKLTFLEVLLSQDDFISDLSQSQQNKLSQLKYNKYEQKQQFPDIYGITLYTPYITDGFLNTSETSDIISPFVLVPSPGQYSIKWIYSGGVDCQRSNYQRRKIDAVASYYCLSICSKIG